MKETDLIHAGSYKEWLTIATEIDKKSDKFDWRKNEDSNLFHSKLLREDIENIKKYRLSQNGSKLVEILLESLSRHFWELNNSELYTHALSGTKFIISEYMQEIEDSIHFMCDTDIEGFSDKQKLDLLKEGNRIHGNTVLMLSGGASFGIYHLGVVKALWEEKSLPKIITGSSMGSIVAASICTKTDKELDEFFKDLSVVHKVALKMYPPAEILKQKSIMDPKQLQEHIKSNIGNYTFREAYKKSGRILNITVSATRKRQKPRVLNHLTAPHILIESSALASCSLPGLFPPVTLKAKNRDGEVVPYMKSETWIDGSVHLDIPMQRIMRLHNVSRSIVSQANPHVLPFVPEKTNLDPVSFTKDLIQSSFQTQALKLMDLGVEISEKMPWFSFLDKIRSMIDQEYRGDINISYPMTLDSIPRIAANPSEEEYRDYIKKGEEATWPKIAFIKDQLRLNQILEDCIEKLKKKLRTIAPLSEGDYS